MHGTIKIPIKETLLRACSGDHTNRHMQDLYRLVYAIAFRMIRQRAVASNLSSDMLGLSEADITHDCIAELFILGNSNELREIRKYFDYRPERIEDLNEEILLMHLRKLVFTVVSDNIFRLYNEADPSFGKILRNIKLAVAREPVFIQSLRFGESYLELKSADPEHGRPTMPEDELDRLIGEIMSDESDIPRILERLSSDLRNQDFYGKRVRMLSLARAIKQGYRNQQPSELAADKSVDATFTEESTEQIIRETCGEIESEMMTRYVRKNKLTLDTFLLYIEVVRRVLRSEFIAGTNGETSYFEHLSAAAPGITHEEYLDNHRIRLEYFCKISKKRVREKLKEIL